MRMQKKIRVADQTLPSMRQTICMAQEMGKSVGRREILLRSMPPG